MQQLVDAAFIQQHPEARLIDLRWAARGPPAREKYAQGHLPGAVFVDLDADLSDRSRGHGRHPLPPAEQFARVLSRLGVTPETTVVVYDDANGAVAARLWFMLRLVGHERVAVLDGGMQAWPGPLTTEVPHVEPAPLRTLRYDPELLAGDDEVERLVRERPPGTALIDARAAERYRGEVEPIDPRAGHIPGAHNKPFSANLDGNGRFKPVEALRALYAELSDDVVASCGSGVTACHDLLALALAGRRGRLYVGSWSGWIEDPTHPIATGPGVG